MLKKLSDINENKDSKILGICLNDDENACDETELV